MPRLIGIFTLLLVVTAFAVFVNKQRDRDAVQLSEWKGIPIGTSWINTSDQDDYFAYMVEDPVAEVESLYVSIMQGTGWTAEDRTPLNPGPGPGGTRFARRFHRGGDAVTIQFYDSVSRTGIVIDRTAGD